MLGIEKVAERGDPDRPLEVGRGLVQHSLAAEQRRVVHEYVDPAPTPQHLANVPLDRGLVRYVTGRGPEAELAGRRAELPPLPQPLGCGWLSVYARSVRPLSPGATRGGS